MSDSSTAIAYVNNKGGMKSKNTMKLQKKYGYGVLKTILSFVQLTYQENTILKYTGFPENSTII